jgi:phosphoglycerol transferase
MSQFLVLSSILSVAVASVLLKKSSNNLERVFAPLLVLILGAETVLFLVADWFTGQGVDESVVFHLKFGIQGAGFGDYSALIAWAAVGLLATVVLAILTALRLQRLKNHAPASSAVVFLGMLVAASLLHPAALGFLGSQSSPLRVVITEEHGDFAGYYRNPMLRTGSGSPKNVVVLFLESVERSYFDESVFPGLITGLRELENEAVSFTRIEQLPWTGWTIGGLTAGLCGLPLFSPSHSNYSMTGMEHFLPAATCMGDMLANEGYALSYFSGSSVEFAGTGKLFSSHGFSQVIGVDGLSRKLPDADTSGWGLTDDVLLDYAYAEFERKSRSPAPFGIFVSTIDTHPPKGRLSPGCSRRQYLDGENEMLNAIACTDEVVGKFVKRILDSPYADQTVVVLASDHLTLPSQAASLLAQTDRTNLFLVLDPQRPPARVDRRGSPLDMGPTVLSAMGYAADLALGRNLFDQEPTISELVPDLGAKVNAWYSSIIQFWGFPNLERNSRITVRGHTGEIDAGGTALKFPLLMEIDAQGGTVVRFDSRHEGYRLYDFMARMPPRKDFVWVDDCASVSKAFEAPNEGLCMLYGHSAGAGLTLKKVDGTVHLTRKDIALSSEGVNPPRTASTKREHATDRERIIAHAGGMVKGRKYTNTLEALERNYARGFRKFELDIIRTSDGHFVAAHDWPFWKNLSGHQGDIPPTLEVFLQTPILGDLTPLDMGRINTWFEAKPDAVLITDKVNDPAAFAEQFIDRGRLVMELFSAEAVKEGTEAGIRSAMASGNVVRRLGDDAPSRLKEMGVTEVAISRKLLNTNGALLEDLRASGIRAYVFHVNQTRSHDEKFALCNDLDFVYGFYADSYDFANPPDCSTY